MRLFGTARLAALTFSLLLLGFCLPAAAQKASPNEHWAQAHVKQMSVDQGVKTDAIRIKSSPLYRDETLEQANWFAKALDGFGAWLEKLFHRDPPPDSQKWSPPSILGTGVIYFMWGVLACIAAAFLFFAVRMFRWRIKLTRKAKTILEEDEPERTLDEWLERADLLEKQGLYREAVRCLYLACLLKFDEAGVARFDRGQTNWEHLRRIESSPNLPPHLEFRAPTRAFDEIWYGMRVKGASDVARFREWYQQVAGSLMRRAA